MASMKALGVLRSSDRIKEMRGIERHRAEPEAVAP
jgi:hypothetical protein